MKSESRQKERRTYAKEVGKDLDGKEVELKGWIHEIRDQSKVKFILLRDITGVVQVVVKEGEPIFSDITKVQRESVVSIKGIVQKSNQAQGGAEVKATGYTVLSEAEPTLPIPVVEKGSMKTTLPKRLDYRPIDLRKPANTAVFKVQSAIVQGMQEYLSKKGFIQVFTPCLMGVASESGSEVFEVNYYKRKSFLRQDPQLHRQLAILGGIEKLYDIGPSWRAEKSHTVKHLSEHRTCAVELAFIKDETDTMRVEEGVIVAAIKNIKEKCAAELELLGVKLKVPETPFPELQFPQIYDILSKEGKDIYGEDPDAEAEKILWAHVHKKYKSEFYFFNHFPFKIKPFYVMRIDDNPEWARSVDLNFKGLELSSGGQREHRYNQLVQQVKEKGLNQKNIEWFTKFFRYAAPPHGGFAIGIERLTQSLLNLGNVREATLFPRDEDRLEP